MSHKRALVDIQAYLSGCRDSYCLFYDGMVDDFRLYHCFNNFNSGWHFTNFLFCILRIWRQLWFRLRLCKFIFLHEVEGSPSDRRWRGNRRFDDLERFFRNCPLNSRLLDSGRV